MSDVRCPECGGELVLRKGKFGEFYGCSSYPTCMGKMNVRDAAIESKTDESTKAMRTNANKELASLGAVRGWTNLQTARWVRETMGLNWDESNVNLFTSKQCEFLLAYIKLERSSSSENEMMLAMKRAQRRKKL